MRGVALALAVTAAVLGLRFGSFAAGGADSYGYVSQADLWRQRRLIIDEPLADQAEWRYANWTLTPLGYRPGDERGTMVPTYAPGLPIAMALFKTIGGERAVFYVVPLLGALAVWLTFLLGVRLGGSLVGVLAAAALLVSPPFLYQLMWPMSDVPAMAWWLAALVLAIEGSTAALAGAGAASALAILTRPNLVVIALPLLLFVIGQPGTIRQRLLRGAAFAIAMAPGPAAVAAINHHLYGSAFASGYGTFSTIYAAGHLLPNLVNYSTWLVQTQTPFIVLALAAPWALNADAHSRTRAVASLCLGIAGVVALSYLFYTPFDHWNYLRFLLPAYPPLLALAAAVFVRATPEASPRRAAMCAALVALLAAWGVWTGRAAFQVREQEARYVAAGRFGRELPENAVILSNQHSGSLRYYAHRITMRFEWLAPDVYEEALDHFRRVGRPVYAVLDDDERAVVRARYGAVANLSWLDAPPLVIAARRVYFYTVIPAPERPGNAGL